MFGFSSSTGISPKVPIDNRDNVLVFNPAVTTKPKLCSASDVVYSIASGTLIFWNQGSSIVAAAGSPILPNPNEASYSPIGRQLNKLQDYAQYKLILTNNEIDALTYFYE